MARRAKTSFQPVHLIAIFGIIAILAFGGYQLLHRSSDPVPAGGDLNLREYLDNSNALSGNTYKVEGIVGERLDNWRSDQGRLYSLQIEDASESAPVPILVPSKFNSTNIQRNQRYRFTVRVQAETGILEVQALTKV